MLQTSFFELSSIFRAYCRSVADDRDDKTQTMGF